MNLGESYMLQKKLEECCLKLEDNCKKMELSCKQLRDEKDKLNR